MILKSNREREELIFANLKDKFQLSSEFLHGDSPDYVGSYKGERLGIEITEIYASERLRRFEVQKDQIVNCARKKAIEIGLPPLRVIVRFGFKINGIKKGRRNYLSDKLFELVKINCPKYGDRIELDYENDIPDEFDLIVIKNTGWSKIHIWYVERVGFVTDSFSDKLQQRIDSKAEKIESYLTKCDRCWLVIVGLGISPSNFYEIDKDMEPIIYKSPFEKVFFLEAFSKILKELKVESTE